MRRYFDWLDRVRDPDRDGLIATLQPDESGLDHTPKYDAYLGISGPTSRSFNAAWERVAGPYAEVGREPERMFALDRFVVRGRARQHHLRREPAGARRAPASHGRRRAARRRCGRADAQRGERSSRSAATPSAASSSTSRGTPRRRLQVSTVTSLMPLLPDMPQRAVDALVGHLDRPRDTRLRSRCRRWP